MDREKILIVDDQEDNLQLLYGLLRSVKEFDILVASDGPSSLEVVEISPPDLILLDVMMPGLNGFEVCRRLKSAPATMHIPIIFMTALTETSSKVEGFSVGGVDYITKPFQQEEVLARIRTHLTIGRLQRELRNQNAQLDAFAHTAAHDLKNPLNGILGTVELARFACEDQNIPAIQEELEKIANLTNKTSDIIEALLLLAGTSKHTQLFLEPFDMGYVMPKVRERMEFMLEEYDADLHMPEEWPFVSGYPAWVEEIWVNYLSNALKYGGRPPQVELGYDEEPEQVRFWVRDNGPGLSAEQQDELFVPFSRLHTQRAEGHGLGLSIVRQISERLGGVAGVESTPGQGCSFYFTLPRQTPYMENA